MILALNAWWGLAIAAGAALAYALLALATSRLGSGTIRSQLLAAWLLHALTLAEGLLGTPPRFGFAPALSMTVWLVLSVYAIERRLFPQLSAHWALAGLGSAAVVLSLIFPGASYHAIASPWLPLHWALGIASYGLFAAAVVHGWLMGRAERAIRLATQTHAGVPLLTLERLTFRFVEAGFVLLSATLLVGWLFA
ncbi:MAG: cytochrome c biogenesis protein CcsA, partial [Polaromonas sp.]|nr:cytochrome c biogenesis protein CcsA [Polaromonas sp.]